MPDEAIHDFNTPFVRGDRFRNAERPLGNHSAVTVRHRLKTLIESALGIRFYRSLPHGIDYRVDLVRHGFAPQIVIDVGANEGQAACHVLEVFPDVQIHCFEPVPATFERLCRRVGPLGGRCVQQAMGRSPGEATINVAANSLTNSIVRKLDGSTEQPISLTTVDAYTAAHGIDVIDLLKIDTEGFETEVLAGAARCFAESRVRFVLIEAGFHFEGPAHVHFERLHEQLRGHGFDLFGFYHQTPCWSGASRLRFADALFAHASVQAG